MEPASTASSRIPALFEEASKRRDKNGHLWIEAISFAINETKEGLKRKESVCCAADQQGDDAHF